MTDSETSSDLEDNVQENWEDIPRERSKGTHARRQPKRKPGLLRHTITPCKRASITPAIFRRYLRNAALETIVMDDLMVPGYVRTAAGLGPKFVYPILPSMRPQDTIGAISAIKQLTGCVMDVEQRQAIYYQLQKSLRNFLRHTTERSASRMRSPLTQKLTAIFTKTKRFLDNNKETMICESDKGKRGIICLKATVERKRNETLASALKDGTYEKFEPLDGETNEQQLIRIHNKAEFEYKSVVRSMLRYILGGITTCTDADLLRMKDMGRRTPDGRVYERRVDNGKVNLIGDKAISDMEHRRIASEAYSMARMYVCIKVHKGDHYPVRPIIAAPAVMGSSMEEWYKDMLTTLITAKTATPSNGVDDAFVDNFRFIAVDTSSVISDIRRNGLKPGHCVVSFDIVSMYTNIDTHLAINAIRDRFSTIARHTTVPQHLFLAGLLCLMRHNSFFTAGGSIYQQAKGLPMGGKLSKILSEIVTANGTAAAIKNAKRKGYVFSFIHKYVDDFIIGVNLNETTRTVENLKEIFESELNGLQLTHETEEWADGIASIKYLDFTIIRQRDVAGIETIWSRQKYASNRLISAYADVPFFSQKNTIAEILKKAIVYSSSGLKREAIHRATMWICNNGYTHKTVDAILEGTKAYKEMLAEEKEDRMIVATAREAEERYASAQDATKQAPMATQRIQTKPGKKAPGQRAYITCTACNRKFRTRNHSDRVCHKCANVSDDNTKQPEANSPDATHQHNNTQLSMDDGIGTQQSTEGGASMLASAEEAANEKAITEYERASRQNRTPDVPSTRNRNDHEAPKTAVAERTPLYIQVPHVKGLDRALNTVLHKWQIESRFICEKSNNGLFSNVKDKIDESFRSMVTFSIWCGTCREHQILSATDTTVQNRIAKHRRHHDNTHEVHWEKPHIIASHPTTARALLAHAFIRQVYAFQKEGLHRDDPLVQHVQQLLQTPHAE